MIQTWEEHHEPKDPSNSLYHPVRGSVVCEGRQDCETYRLSPRQQLFCRSRQRQGLCREVQETSRRLCQDGIMREEWICRLRRQKALQSGRCWQREGCGSTEEHQDRERR